MAKNNNGNKNDELAKLNNRLMAEAKSLREKAKKHDEEAQLFYAKADRIEAVIRGMNNEGAEFPSQ